MIYCLYGQDTYRSKEELRRIVEEYKKSNLDWMDFVRIDADDEEIEIFQVLRQTVDTVSMFSQNKLIIVENIFSSDADIQNEILEFLKKRDIEKNNSIVLAFWDEGIDAKSGPASPSQGGLFEYLKSKAKCEEFKLLGKAQLKSWIKNYIIEQGGNIDIQAIDKLVEYIGSDLWRMENEINKLISFSPNICLKNIELLIRPEIDLNIFELGDAIGQKNKTKAIKLFNQQIDEGKNESYLLSMIASQIRNIIKVKTSPKSKSDLHPFVFQKSSEQARNFTIEELKKIYRQLMTIDFESKIGKTDIKTSLELFISGL